MPESNPIPTVTATGWLVLQAVRHSGGRAREIKLARITQNPPSLGPTQVSIRLIVTVPQNVFDRGLASIVLEVPEELIGEPSISVEAEALDA